MKIFVEWQDRWFKFHHFGYYHNRISAYTVAKSQAKAKQTKVRLVDSDGNLLDIIHP